MILKFRVKFCKNIAKAIKSWPAGRNRAIPRRGPSPRPWNVWRRSVIYKVYEILGR